MGAFLLVKIIINYLSIRITDLISILNSAIISTH